MPLTWSVDSYHFAGIAVGYEQPIRNSQWSVGVELQINGHFGSQELFEVAVPVTLRYHFKDPWPSALNSFAFGLGLSRTSEIYNLEVETRGGSGQTMVHWMIEAEFETPIERSYWVLRVHHRSDGYGIFKPNTGSNGIGLGLKRRF